MSDESTVREAVKTQAELEQDHKRSVEAAAQEIAERAKAEALAGFMSVLEGKAKEVDKNPEGVDTRIEGRKLPEPDTSRDRASGFGAVVDMREYLYKRLPAEQRALRNPRIDHEMARWLRASFKISRDHAAILEWEKRDSEAMARASQLEGTTTATSGLSQGTAGPYIPLPLHNQIIALRNTEAVLRQYCRVLSSPALTLRVPKRGLATAGMVAEGSTVSVGAPSSGSILLSKKKMQWRDAISKETLLDTAFNLVTEFVQAAGEAFAALEDVQICTSAGTGANFTGSLDTPNADSAGAQTITDLNEASSGVLTHADLLKLWYTVPKAYRKHAITMVNTAQAILLARLETTAGDLILKDPNQPAQLVGDSLPNQIGTIFGRPVVEVPVASANNRIYVGDMSYYTILEGDRLMLESSDAVQWTSDLVDYKVTTRIDGGLVATAGFRSMSGLTSIA